MQQPAAPRPTYHLLRQDRAMDDPADLLRVIQGQKFMTLALCCDNEPYLVTLSNGYDPAERCFYFHCAPQGKKLDYLNANPIVWGQVLEDLGYVRGRCSQAFRTVEFRGQAEIVTGLEEKRRVFLLMLGQLEPDLDPVKAQKLTEADSFGQTVMVRVRVLEMTGKYAPVLRD